MMEQMNCRNPWTAVPTLLYVQNFNKKLERVCVGVHTGLSCLSCSKSRHQHVLIIAATRKKARKHDLVLMYNDLLVIRLTKNT